MVISVLLQLLTKTTNGNAARNATVFIRHYASEDVSVNYRLTRFYIILHVLRQ